LYTVYVFARDKNNLSLTSPVPKLYVCFMFFVIAISVGILWSPLELLFSESRLMPELRRETARDRASSENLTYRTRASIKAAIFLGNETRCGAVCSIVTFDKVT